MPHKLSRNLLVVEAVVIALPISILAIIATFIFVNDTRRAVGFNPHDWLGVLSIFCFFAIFSGWRLFIAYLRGGVETLQKQSFGWWAVIIVGVLILTASIISRLLPPSPEYSIGWYFRSDLNLFALASPILIPIVHLVYERFIRK